MKQRNIVNNNKGDWSGYINDKLYMTSAYDCDVVLPCCTAAKPPATTWPRAELDTASSVKTSRFMPCKVKGPGRKQCKHLLRGCESGLEKQYSSEVFPDISRRCFISFENAPNIFRLFEWTFCVFMELFQVSSINLPFGSFWNVCVCGNASSGVMCNICRQKKKAACLIPQRVGSMYHFVLCYIFHSISLPTHKSTTSMYNPCNHLHKHGVSANICCKTCGANQALPSCMRSPGDWAKPPEVANTWCKNHAVQRCHLMYNNSWPMTSGQFRTPSLALFYMF